MRLCMDAILSYFLFRFQLCLFHIQPEAKLVWIHKKGSFFVSKHKRWPATMSKFEILAHSGPFEFYSLDLKHS